MRCMSADSVPVREAAQKLFYAGPLTPTHLDSLRASRTSSLSLASALSSIGTEGPAAPGPVVHGRLPSTRFRETVGEQTYDGACTLHTMAHPRWQCLMLESEPASVWSVF